MSGITIKTKVHFRRGRRSKKELRAGQKREPVPAGRIPRLSRLKVLAIRVEGLVRDGVLTDYAAAAQLGNVTRVRMTQITNLLHLAPDIQEVILFLPPAEIERLVVDQIRAVARDPDIVAATLTEASKQINESLDALETERRSIEQNLARANSEMRSLAIEAIGCEDDHPAIKQPADPQEHVRLSGFRLTEIREETIRLRSEAVSEDEVVTALGELDPMWEMLSARQYVPLRR